MFQLPFSEESLCPSSSLGRNTVPAQDIRAEPFRSEVRKTRNCLFLSSFLYLYLISLQKFYHPQRKQTNNKRFQALFTGSICCFTGLRLRKEEIAGNKRWAYWNVFYFISGLALVTWALWVNPTSFLLWLLAATQLIQRFLLFPPRQICLRKPSYKMLVPLINHVDVTELLLELDAKDVGKYLDPAVQTIKVFISLSVKCKCARHWWLLRTWFADIRVSRVIRPVGFIQTLIS